MHEFRSLSLSTDRHRQEGHVQRRHQSRSQRARQGRRNRESPLEAMDALAGPRNGLDVQVRW